MAKTKLTIETDQPCLVLVLPLPRRVERPRAPRRVIETTGVDVTELPGIRSARRPSNVVDLPVRRVAGKR